MKRFLSIIFLLVSFAAFAQKDDVFPRKPNPPRLVNDYTNTLTPEQVQALEHKLVAYSDSTSNQVAVVIIPTLGKYDVQQLALKILREWGVGTSQHDNGVVLLVAKEDRKVRIETGRGLEGAIPDITAKHIINEDIVPNFKSNNYYRGLDAATDNIIKAAAGEYKAPPSAGKKKGNRWLGVLASIILIGIISAIGGGRGRGGGRGGMMSRRGYSDVGTGWLIGSILSGMTGGGRSGGGGWSGGSGGGFGGFGGGSGGGGGASGSW
jgi:uncharacterized protein